jgi:hypothetical protein
MSAVASSSVILPISDFPSGVDVHWETQHRVVKIIWLAFAVIIDSGPRPLWSYLRFKNSETESVFL